MNVRIILIIFLMGCAWQLQLWGLEPGKAVNQYVQNHWTADHGLPSNTIAAITQTGDGYLWIASRNNLCRFDGVKFKPYKFLDVNQSGYWTVSEMLVSRDNTLWISTFGKGVFKLTPGGFVNYNKEKNLPSDSVISMSSDINNHLWIGTLDKHLCGMDTGTGDIKRFDPVNGISEPQVNCIYSDSRGRLLVGTQDGGLYRRGRGKFHKVKLFPARKIRVSSISVNTICEDSAGDLWIGTDNGLIRYSPAGSRYYTEQDGLSHRSISKLLVDGHGNLWAGTVNGLNRIKRGGKDGKDTIAIDRTMAGCWVTSLFEDKEKNLWAGTRGKGLFQLQDGKLIAFTRREGLPNGNVLSLFQDREKNIWIGMSGNLVKFSGGIISAKTMSIPLSRMQISSIAQDRDGNIWVSTVGSGLFRLKEKSIINVRVSDGLLTDTIGSIAFDSDDRLWVGSQGGLNMLPARNRLSFRPGITFRAGGSERFVPAFPDSFSPGPIQTGNIRSFTTKNGLAGSLVLGIFESPAGQLVVSTSKGINIVEKEKFKQLDTGTLGPRLMVSNIYFDRERTGVMWLATLGHGLVRLENGKMVVYSVKQGMPGNRIDTIFEDNAGFLWMGSDKGIIKIPKLSFFQYDSGEIPRLEPVIYGRKDGMKSDECTRYTQHSALQTRGGRLLFATPEGLAVVEPGNMKVNRFVPPVIVESIWADGVLAAGPDSPDILEPPVFNDVRQIQVSFTAPTFITPAKCRFRYRLEDAEKDEPDIYGEDKAANGWNMLPSGVRTVTVDNPASGDYTLVIAASNSDGVWNTRSTRIPLQVRRSFFHTTLFKYLLLVPLLLAVLVFYRLGKKYAAVRKKSSASTRSPLEEEKSEDHLKKLLYLVEVEKIYRDEDLSLSGMAAKLGVPTYYLSQLLNEKVGKNFHDFLNSHRVEEACKRLAAPDEKHVNILQIAIDAGFNSKVSFNRVFKKYTGTTPSQYRKKHLEGK